MTYGISTELSNGIGQWSDPLITGTILQPQGKFWADVAGGFTDVCSGDQFTPCTTAAVAIDCPVGDTCGPPRRWTRPNFLTNVNDVTSEIKFLTNQPAPHFTAVELLGGDGPTWISFVVNAGDLAMTLQGFRGDPFPSPGHVGYPALLTDCPPCGNDVQQSGEECDGTDDAACSGTSAVLCSVNCTCLCGNNFRQGGEACDGTDDAACPGNCSVDCTCP